MEEIDLCWRLKNLGHNIGCAGQVKVLHLGGGTLNTSSPFKTYLNFRNNLIILLKNKRGHWPLFMFRRMTLDGLAAWRMLLEGQWIGGRTRARHVLCAADFDVERTPTIEALARFYTQ